MSAENRWLVARAGRDLAYVFDFGKRVGNGGVSEYVSRPLHARRFTRLCKQRTVGRDDYRPFPLKCQFCSQIELLSVFICIHLWFQKKY